MKSTERELWAGLAVRVLVAGAASVVVSCVAYLTHSLALLGVGCIVVFGTYMFQCGVLWGRFESAPAEEEMT